MSSLSFARVKSVDDATVLGSVSVRRVGRSSQASAGRSVRSRGVRSGRVGVGRERVGGVSGRGRRVGVGREGVRRVRVVVVLVVAGLVVSRVREMSATALHRIDCVNDCSRRSIGREGGR